MNSNRWIRDRRTSSRQTLATTASPTTSRGRTNHENHWSVDHSRGPRRRGRRGSGRLVVPIRHRALPEDQEHVTMPDSAPPPEQHPPGHHGPVPRVLVAGVGNLFLGDDGFGPEVARQLARHPVPAGVRVTDYGIRACTWPLTCSTAGTD